ncbi:MAG TPA: ABC transporter permease [Puia sp.]|nr:ABC transporter permease [Puia sp.]
MLTTYFKTAWRNLFRNRTTTLINLFGLSVALTAFVFIAIWVMNELTYDGFHKNAKDIFLVQMKFTPTGEASPITPLPLGETLRQNPDLDFVATMGRWSGTLNNNGNLFDDKAGIAVDSGWFNIFDYTVLSGDIRSFNNHPFSIIFTQSKARQIFGNRDPVGQVIKLDTTLYQVRAVLKDNPINSSLQFDMLVPMAARLAYRKGDLGNWTNASYRTFIRIHPNTNVSSFLKNANALVDRTSAKAGRSLALQPLRDLHFDTNSSDPAFRRGSRTAVLVFSVLALLLLISASINYINLTIAEVNSRIKEISIRKIIGGNSIQLFLQFLTESFLQCLIALALSSVIMWLALPFFDRLTETNFQLFTGSWIIWLFFLATLVISTGVNGVFPALTVAFFKPLDFLHGSTILKFANLFIRKGLVVFQFIIGILLMIGTIVIFRQMQLARNSSAQYNRAQVVSFELPSQTLQKMGYDQKNINRLAQTLRNELQAQSCIQEIVFASTSIEGALNSNGARNWYWPGMDTSISATVASIWLEPGARNIFNLQLVEGRWFFDDRSDNRNFILNETAVRTLGLREPVVGQTFARLGEDTGRIIGVIKDYNFTSLYNKIEPLVIGDFDDEIKPLFFVKIAPDNIAKAMTAISAAWKNNIPEAPLQYQFMDQAFDNLYKDDLKVSELVLIFSSISLVISALGLFSLSAFVAVHRKKEIGIRKVMGAAATRITLMLLKEFLVLVLVAVIIASPIGYWVMHNWLHNFTYKVALNWWVFAVAGIAALLISFITVSFHAVRAAVANPLIALRSE